MSGPFIETPPCAVCGQFRHGRRARHHLTHGVSLWLCDTHRGDAYLRRDGGRDFVARMSTVWAASDGLTSRRRKALRTHLRTVGVPAARELPGSYSWPALRREAERRFAAGEAPNQVITDLRRTYADGPSIVPSVRTMRRWFTQARWLSQPPRAPEGARRVAPRPRVGPLTPREQMVNLLLTGYGNRPRDDLYRPRGP